MRKRLQPLLLTAAVAACTSITDVRAPDIVEPPSLENSAGAETLRLGAINSFVLAFASGVQSQILTSGVFADEFSDAAGQFASFFDVDRRSLQDPDPLVIAPYQPVQRARVNANYAIKSLQKHAPSPRSKIGEMFALAAFAEVFLAENMCSGIPLGSINGGSPAYGDPLTTTAMFERSVADFDSAIAYSTDSARILALARIGRARALLNLGRANEAAAAVSGVPTSSVYVTEHSAATQPNVLFQFLNTSRAVTVSDREGLNGLDFRSARDPRVTTAAVGKGIDGVTDVFSFGRYNSLAAPVPLATGTEARLIEAEALLKAGMADSSLSILNSLRAAFASPNLPPLLLEPTDAGRVNQLFRERAFWLFGTGHRHGDLRRLVRQYTRSAESVFPTGAFKTGQVYGPDVTFTADATQLENHAFNGCLNRNP